MNNLSEDEINLLLKALDSWVDSLNEIDNLASIMNTHMMRSRMSQSQVRELEISLEDVRIQKRNRDRASTKLKAKLYGMLEQLEMKEAMK